MAQFFGYRRLGRAADWEGLAGAWVPGRSAYELAHSWQTAGGLPPAVRTALASSGHEVLLGLKLDVCLAEKPVFLDTFTGPSMTDLMAYGRNSRDETVVVGVEGKADESFGPRTDAWVRGLTDRAPLEGIPRKTRTNRLAFLAEHLSIDISVDSELRYQLLHRTASVLLEGELHAAAAVLLVVHAFGSLCDDNWHDYSRFIQAFGLPMPALGRVSGPAGLGRSRAMPTYFLWTQDSVSLHEDDGRETR